MPYIVVNVAIYCCHDAVQKQSDSVILISNHSILKNVQE